MGRWERAVDEQRVAGVHGSEPGDRYEGNSCDGRGVVDGAARGAHVRGQVFLTESRELTYSSPANIRRSCLPRRHRGRPHPT